MRDRVYSMYWVTVISIVRVVACVCLVNHFLACIWYGIGSLENGWVSTHDFSQLADGSKYMLALHWCLAQFQSGTAPFAPQDLTLLERVFAVVMLLFALMSVSSLLSTITNAMIQ